MQTPPPELLNALGLAAKQLASLIFVSGLDLEFARALYIDPIIDRFQLELSIEVDEGNRKVTVTAFDQWSSIAQVREGIGATLLLQQEPDIVLPSVDLPTVPEKPLCNASQQELAQQFELTALHQAMTEVFNPQHNTLAVVVLHQGKVIAEQYADGIEKTTPLPGWSMGKSVTATLVGLLVKRGLLDIHKPGVVPEWQSEPHDGEQVTLDHLLRMTSGLDLVEDQSGADPNSQMLFVEPDAAAFAAARGLIHHPGEHWEYMSGNTLLACRAIYQAAGNSLQSSQAFYREALLKPLGAPSFILETDAAGTFVGSSYILATARDWAKFGQLYLEDGQVDGDQILPEDWRVYVSRHTPQSGSNSYGAGFWTIEHSDYQGIPRDAYYANGFQGQYVFILPSQSLVIVRLGASLGPTGIWQFVGDVVSAMH